MKSLRNISLVLAVAVSCPWHSAIAQQQAPLWEAGLGAFAMQIPAYRGASESISTVIPIPYVIYRGEYLKADRDGVRGIFFETDTVEMNMSFAASPPIESGAVAVRQGMPGLSASLEVGPSLDIKLWNSPTKDVQLRVFLPVRAAYTLERDPQYIGWQFAPRLNLDIEQPLGLPGWTLGTVAGPIYGSQEQHAYFYGVAPQFNSPARSSYNAKGGYAGVQVISALWKRFPAFWVGGFVRYDNLHGAVFEDSPLVTQRNRFSGGLAVTWVLGKSSQMVSVD